MSRHHKTKSITKIDVALALAFFGMATFAAAGSVLQVDLKRDNKALLKQVRQYEVSTRTVIDKEGSLNLPVDLEADTPVMNVTNDFGDPNTEHFDVIGLSYRNAGFQTIEKPFRLKVVFDSPLTIQPSDHGEKVGVEHITATPEVVVVNLVQYVTNHSEILKPIDSNNTTFYIPITNTAESIAEEPLQMNQYDLEPGEWGHAVILVPKIFMEDIGKEKIGITMIVDHNDDVKEANELNNVATGYWEVSPKVGFCKKFTICEESTYDECYAELFPTVAECLN